MLWEGTDGESVNKWANKVVGYAEWYEESAQGSEREKGTPG